MPARVPTFCVGIVLGGAFTWWSLARPEPNPASARHADASHSWSASVAPSLLTPEAAADALTAWLSWRRSTGGKTPGASTQLDHLRGLLLRLPPEFFPRLLDSLSPANSDEDQRLRHVAFTAWAEKDPASAAPWAVARNQDSELLKLAREAVDAWAALDPRAASAWACSISEAKAALDLASRALVKLAAQDPAAALALASSRGDAFRDEVVSNIVDTLGAKDPAGTLRTFAPALWDGGKGCFKFLSTIEAWARQDPSAAAAWLLAQPRLTSRYLTNCLINLHDVPPAWHRTVANALLDSAATPDRSRLVADAVAEWRRKNPAEALAWLQDVADPDLRLTLLERVIQSSSEQPDQDLALVMALPEGGLRDEKIGEQLTRWARQSPDDALAWMKTHESLAGVADAAASVHATLLGELARDDPRQAIAGLQNLSDPKARQSAVAAIANSWGQTDPAAAFQWMTAEQEKSGRIGLSVSPSLLAKWAKADPESALRWVEDWFVRQPETASAFGYAYFAAFTGTNGETAPRANTADLYAKIRDPRLRLQTLKRHVAEWLTKDPAAARTWVETSPALSPGQRAEILAAKP